MATSAISSSKGLMDGLVGRVVIWWKESLTVFHMTSYFLTSTTSRTQTSVPLAREKCQEWVG